MTEEEQKQVQVEHRLEAAQARDRRKERSERTRRLIQEGAILENIWPEVSKIPLGTLKTELSRRFRGA